MVTIIETSVAGCRRFPADLRIIHLMVSILKKIYSKGGQLILFEYFTFRDIHIQQGLLKMLIFVQVVRAAETYGEVRTDFVVTKKFDIAAPLHVIYH